MKTNVGRLLTGVVALALLLGGFGLMQDSAQAQATTFVVTSGTGIAGISFAQSCDNYPDRTATDALGTVSTSCALDGDNRFAIGTSDGENFTATAAGVEVQVLNTGLERRGNGNVPGDNPRIFNVSAGTDNAGDAIPAVDLPATLNLVPRSTFLQNSEIPAYSGNGIQITYRPAGTLGGVQSLTVDNVKPNLVTSSPSIPLVVKGGVDITFSLDITDNNSGGLGTKAATIAGLSGDQGALRGIENAPRGGVRLVVAGNRLSLAEGAFTAIDNGWRVETTVNSTAIEGVSKNTPWFFEVTDLAGNTRRSTGSIKGKPSEDSTNNTTFTDDRFAGTLTAQAFNGAGLKLTRGTETYETTIESVSSTTDATTLTFTLAAAWDPAFPDVNDPETDADETNILASDSYEILTTNLITVDASRPTMGVPETGKGWSGTAETSNRKNSIKVPFSDGSAGSGLDAGSVTPSAFTVSGNTVTGVTVNGNVVYLTLADNLASTEKPTVGVVAGMVADKAGNTVNAASDQANDGLGPNLALSEDSDLSKTSITISITADEQLRANPTPTLTGVGDGDGTLITMGTQVCVENDDALTIAGDAAYRAEFNDTNAPGCAALDEEGDPIPDPNDDTMEMASTTASVGTHPDAPHGTGTMTQSAALAYTYVVNTGLLKEGKAGGKFNLHIEGCDTQGGDVGNCSTVGDDDSANDAGAFTFQVDTKLNDGVDPIVSVSDNKDVEMYDTAVEQVDPMIITVDWTGEAGEYPGDTYSTVTLTSAELTVRFDDGTTETTTFDVATQVSSQDNRKYTIPLLNAKVGEYTLTVEGVDAAGNASDSAGHSASWSVVAPKAVDIELKPGWNLISLPFQPANPAINSVIPSDHPIGLVMTFDGAEGVWLFSRRDAETGLFTGDVAAMTATSAYFVNTNSFRGLSLFRPPSATAVAAPAQPPAIPVSEGWNLVPVASTAVPTPTGIDADTYFGTLGTTWLRALAWNPLARTWIAISPAPAGSANVAAEDTRCGVTTETGPKVCIGEGLWLWVTEDGTLIPG